MLILESYGLAVVFCFVTMVCWGSWANTQKLADKGWLFERYYCDYTIGSLLLSLIFASTIGSIGDQCRGFLEDVAQADRANIQSVIIGCVFFNIANILLVAAISIAGMSVAFPV